MDNSKSNKKSKKISTILIENEFEVGDTVQLKSGGPIMTVDEILDNHDVRCLWFAEGKLETGVFRPDTLKYAYPNEK